MRNLEELGYDMEGSKNDLKKFIDSLGANQVSFLGIQESHSTKIDQFKVKSMWGNFRFDFVEQPSNGRSGGLVSIWDPKVFSRINEFQFEHFLIVEGIWIATHIHFFMINVYAPQDVRRKQTPWKEMLDFMNNNRGNHLIFGDFNEDWSSNRKNTQTREKEELIKKINAFDADITSRNSNSLVNGQRAIWIDNLRKIELNENIDSSHKAKIKWCIEADENSKFYHAIVNQKRRYLAIYSRHQIRRSLDRRPPWDQRCFYKLLRTEISKNHIKSKGVWYRIVGSINYMHEKNFIPHSSMQRNVNNGASTKFWHNSWNGNSPFKFQFPRLFRLAMNKDCLVRDCWNNGWHIEWVRNVSNGSNASQVDILQNSLSAITLKDSEDVWVWTIDSPSFSVKSARCHIDRGLLP
ncbi:RNA-directed DNA polymerase, eukaryota, Reverse transcriptase zinc-binding domain protein [Artemisia annua]|uniref:RNA-directed DNA polymerase, eukaryota, Reverse transcriptase zinc-binding domain protein n=1 Tax=Artemisia annua TaxID=35608 RepID=A0A2U1P429_ARTAN|nr:RNA-directed DNA polymerase, eukaryota, Reverse transcriptase zinc-binding domain protein [Artemisia annua]